MQSSRGGLGHKKHRSVRFHSVPGYRPRLWEVRKAERDSERKHRSARMYASIQELMRAERK